MRRLNTTFDDWVRALALLVAINVVGYLAIFGSDQIAPLAAGALISLLGAAVSFLFRGRIETPPTSRD